jgi:hypothetical protein
LHSNKWNDGKTKKRWKPFPPKNNLIQDSEGNEEKGYPFQTPTKQRYTTPRNQMKPTRTSSKKKSCK